MPSKKRTRETVLRFVGSGRFRGAPARDLTAGDIARLAYIRALSVSGAEGIRPDPRNPDPALIQTITAELIGSGLYKPED